MEKETPTGSGTAKKRKFSTDQQQPVSSPSVLKLKLESKEYEIERLSKYISKLEAQVTELEAENENWEANIGGDKENDKEQEKMDIKNVDEVAGNNDQIARDKAEKMESEIKEQEKKIQELEAKVKATKENEEKLKSENEKLKKDVKNLLQQNSTLKEQLGSRETSLQNVTVEEIHNGDSLNYHLLSPEHVVIVLKLEALKNNLWNLYSSEDAEPFEMDIVEIYKRTKFRISLTGSLICNDQENSDRINEIVQVVYTWTHQSLDLGFQKLDDHAFKKLASDSVKNCKLQNITVKKSNGAIMKADEIFAELPEIEDFEYGFKHYKDESLSNIAEDFSKLPTFKNLGQFKFCNANNRFDLEKFGKFMKKYPNTHFVVHYHPLGQTTQLKIQGIVQKLSETCRITVELTDK